jgi:hypothetical protein
MENIPSVEDVMGAKFAGNCSPLVPMSGFGGWQAA